MTAVANLTRTAYHLFHNCQGSISSASDEINSVRETIERILSNLQRLRQQFNLLLLPVVGEIPGQQVFEDSKPIDNRSDRIPQEKHEYTINISPYIISSIDRESFETITTMRMHILNFISAHTQMQEQSEIRYILSPLVYPDASNNGITGFPRQAEDRTGFIKDDNTVKRLIFGSATPPGLTSPGIPVIFFRDPVQDIQKSMIRQAISYIPSYPLPDDNNTIGTDLMKDRTFFDDFDLSGIKKNDRTIYLNNITEYLQKAWKPVLSGTDPGIQESGKNVEPSFGNLESISSQEGSRSWIGNTINPDVLGTALESLHNPGLSQGPQNVGIARTDDVDRPNIPVIPSNIGVDIDSDRVIVSNSFDFNLVTPKRRPSPLSTASLGRIVPVRPDNVHSPPIKSSATAMVTLPSLGIYPSVSPFLPHIRNLSTTAEAMQGTSVLNNFFFTETGEPENPIHGKGSSLISQVRWLVNQPLHIPNDDQKSDISPVSIIQTGLKAVSTLLGPSGDKDSPYNNIILPASVRDFSRESAIVNLIQHGIGGHVTIPGAAVILPSSGSGQSSHRVNHFNNQFTIHVNMQGKTAERDVKDLARKIGTILSDELKRYGGVM